MRKFASYLLYTILIAGIACACSDHLDIKQAYDFKVTTLPVPKKIKKGQTIEIRCELIRENKYDNAKYFLRYFQPDGKGELKMDDKVFLPNDSYVLEKESFRLYYTSQSEDQQVVDITFFDNFGKEYVLSFSFNNDNEG